MNIKVMASTKVGNVTSKEELEDFGGKAAGVCYMANTFDDLLTEDIEKTKRRINQTKGSGHHSVYEHGSFSLYLEDVPKIIAMTINNEKQYSTSEKSGKYTRHDFSQKEQIIYNKWLEIFKNKITQMYANDYQDGIKK